MMRTARTFRRSERIKLRSQTCRLIAILRNPVDRASLPWSTTSSTSGSTPVRRSRRTGRLAYSARRRQTRPRGRGTLRREPEAVSSPVRGPTPRSVARRHPPGPTRGVQVGALPRRRHARLRPGASRGVRRQQSGGRFPPSGGVKHHLADRHGLQILRGRPTRAREQMTGHDFSMWDCVTPPE